MQIDKRQYDQLAVEIYPDNPSLGLAAAQKTASVINQVLAERDSANLILATGNSMLTFLSALSLEKTVDWSRVSIFHMDEYLGMSPDHPASFRRFLREKIVDKVTPHAFYGINGQSDRPEAECQRYTELLRKYPADLCCLGIGENGHLAFNDPPVAEFDDLRWVKIVALAEKSRLQQVGEGHFEDLTSVPTHAITLTIPALLSAKQVIGIVPEMRKAAAVSQALTGPISTSCPASILRRSPNACLLLDRDSASKLS